MENLVRHTAELTGTELREIRALLDGAFDGDFADEDFEHALGGMHALVRDAGGDLVAHGSVVMRRVVHRGAGPAHRVRRGRGRTGRRAPPWPRRAGHGPA